MIAYSKPNRLISTWLSCRRASLSYAESINMALLTEGALCRMPSSINMVSYGGRSALVSHRDVPALRQEGHVYRHQVESGSPPTGGQCVIGFTRP